jgi:cell division protein ZapE
MGTIPTTHSLLMPPVSARYQALVDAGELEDDAAQRNLAGHLDDVLENVSASRLASKKSSLGWMFGSARNAGVPIRGLYIWGDVGRGKTMLMDMFHELARLPRKRRCHFHEFMADIHDRIHATRKMISEGKLKDGDPIAPVAAAIAREVRLLCFDEFSVTDIADAMILGRLFTQLFKAGVIVVATSNVKPDDLYGDGLNRRHFLEFVQLLKRHTDVVHLNARTDFRLEMLNGAQVYITPVTGATAAQIDVLWRELTGTDRGQPAFLEVKSRHVEIPQSARGSARFDFDQLCDRPLGAADYLKIAHAYHTVFIDRIPVLGQDRRNAAKRFINLIDTLYDNRVKLVASAEAPPGHLYIGDSGYEVFEFGRTASRLIEMQSRDYLARPHGSDTLLD